MKLTIFGATGRAGKPLVEHALAAGYEVIAFVRTPSKLTTHHDRLTVVQGDATDPLAVERAVQGTDVVISVMASSRSPKIAKSKPLTRGTQNILNAMKKYRVNRLIISAGSPLPQPNDTPDIRFKLLRVIVKLLALAAYKDTAGSIEIVRASDVEWTIVRMGRAADGPPTGVKAGYVNRDMGIRITGADAAAFILSEVQQGKYIRLAPVICSR
jgi:hypothetical protein